MNAKISQYIIDKNEKPTKFISDITERENVGFLMVDGTKVLIVTDNNGYASQAFPSTVISKISNKRLNKSESVREFNRKYKKSIDTIYGFNTVEDSLNWAINSDKGDVIYNQ